MTNPNPRSTIDCPACHEPGMSVANVVCWPCYRYSDRLTPGTHSDPETGYLFTFTVDAIAKWDRARDARWTA